MKRFSFALLFSLLCLGKAHAWLDNGEDDVPLSSAAAFATGGGGGGGAFFNDTFTEGSNTPLESHTPETGSWDGAFADIAHFDIVGGGGIVELDAAGVNYIAAAATTPSDADYTVEATGKTDSTDAADRVAVCGRLVAGVDGYCARFQGSGAWNLNRVDDGAFTALDSGTIASFSSTQEYKVTLQMTGTTIVMKIDDSQVSSVIDATYSAAGVPGINMRGSLPDITLFVATN